MKLMIRFVILICVLVTAGCTKKTEQVEVENEPMTTRQKAERVGKFGDRTLTNNLEKNLVGIVDKADEHAKELSEAAGE